MTEYFQPGQAINVHEVLHGKVWSVCPMLVVQDTPELTVLYFPQGTPWKELGTASGGRVGPEERVHAPWKMTDATVYGAGILCLIIPGEPFS